MTLLDANQLLQCHILDLRGEWAVPHGFGSLAEDGGQTSGVIERIDLDSSACDRLFFCARINF